MKLLVRLMSTAGAISCVAALGAPVARAQGSHAEGHLESGRLPAIEIAAGLAHGVGLGTAVFLVGLPVFAALVWRPASREEAAGKIFAPFGRWVWALFGLLVVAGAVEVSLYAVRASGEPFGLGLLWQALSETRVGHVWLVRLGVGALIALLASWALDDERGLPRWVLLGAGCVMLITLTQLSHAAEGNLVTLMADWLHVIAGSVWVGGLLGFPMLLLGPLRGMQAEERSRLLGRAVRRFSIVTTAAVAVLVVTGVYASLLRLPDLSALVETAYGRALIMKLGMVTLMLAVGAINLHDRGRDPFGRMVMFELLLALGVFVATGFLTSLPPPGTET